MTQDWAQKRVLITGATGFLGGAVARDLAARGAEVIALGRNIRAGERLRREGITFHTCDLATEPAILQKHLHSLDAVVHSAARTNPWGPYSLFHAANVTATEHVMQACWDHRIPRVVHISSPSVLFDFKAQRDLDEATCWTSPPANAYIATKRLAEQWVQAKAAEGLNVITLRPRALFGPGDTTLLPRILRVAKRGAFPLIGGGNPRLDLTWIDDAVNAVRLALLAPDAYRGRLYHVTSGDPQPRQSVFETLFQAKGLKVQFRPVSLPAAFGIASVLEQCSRWLTLNHWEPPLTRYTVALLALEQTLDISAARRDLGYHPNTQVLQKLREVGQTMEVRP